MAKRSNRSARIRRQTRNGRVKTVLFSLFLLAVAVTAGVLAVTVFFKVAAIQVTGKTRYAPKDLEQTLGVHQGDNLFLWGQTIGIRKVRENYPYIDTIKVHRKLPDTLIFEIQECKPVAAMHDGNAYWLIDANGKLLESVTQQAAQKYIGIEGVTAGKQTAGQTLDPQQNDAALVLLHLLQELRENNSMARVKFINLSRLYDIHIGYDGKYDVWLGTIDSVDHKLKFLNTIIKEKLSPSDIGVIDVTDNTSARFQPDTAANVAAAAKAHTSKKAESAQTGDHTKKTGDSTDQATEESSNKASSADDGTVLGAEKSDADANEGTAPEQNDDRAENQTKSTEDGGSVE